SGLTSLISTQGININDSGGSTLLDPKLTTLNGVSVTLDGTDPHVADPWTKFFDSSLYVTGGAYRLAGLTDVDQSGLHVSNGGSLTLPNLTSYASNGTFEANGTNTATGTASVLNVSALTTVTQVGGWTVNAGSGGTVNLSGLTSLISTQGININDSGGSTLLDPKLTTLNGVSVTLDGTDAHVADPWTKFFDSSLYVTGGAYRLAGLTDVDQSGLHVSNGGSLTLPNLTSYASNGTFEANGTNTATGTASVLNVSALTTVTQVGGWTVNAGSGGTVNLSGLTSLISTQGININDSGGSTLLDPKLTTLNGVSVTLDGTDAHVADPWTKFFDSSLYVTGGAYRLAGLTDVDQSGLHVSNGGSLTLPNLTSYASNGTFEANGTNTATGTASVLNVSALTTVTQVGGWTVNAGSGGTVNLSGLTSLISTQGININDSGGSTLLDPKLTTLNGVSVTLDGTDAHVADPWTKFFDSSLYVTGGAYRLAGLTDVDQSGLHVSSGGSLTLPNLTSYASNGTFEANGTNTATGTASVLNVSALTTVTQVGGWTVNAGSGGTVNLS